MSLPAKILADDPGLVSVANMLMRRYGDSCRFTSTDTVDHTMRVLYHALVTAEGTPAGIEIFQDTKDPRILEVINEILRQRILSFDPAGKEMKEEIKDAK